jgi:Matrixin/Carboxypeptidase regulatory-like domain
MAPRLHFAPFIMSLRILPALLALVLSIPAFAATRLTYDIQGTPTALEWAPTAFPLPYELDRRIAQGNPAAAAVIDKAFSSWTQISNANVQFEPRGVTDRVAEVSSGRVVVSIADDLFRNQGAVAITTYTFDNTTGHLTDADIMVDPSLLSGQFNLQMAMEHEIGHVLGLDHSGVISAVMYPYVSSARVPATFDSDDRIAIAMAYPKDDPTLTGATLTGRVMGDNGGIFGAQVVAVNERGEPVATELTSASGEFTLSGIPPGRYRLYAEPLDGPVDAKSLRGTWRAVSMASFPTQFFGNDAITVESGKVYGNLVTHANGPVQLNPRWIGACDASSHAISLGSTPATVNPGQTVRLAVGGDGFTSGMTQFEVLNPGFRRVSNFQWSANYVTADFAIDAGASAGSTVVLVKSGNETATLTGALEVYRPSKGRAVRR